MKLRKILAAVAASAVAVSALAISAFAADFPTGVQTYTRTYAAEDVMFEADGVYVGQMQLGHVSALDSLTITYASADGADTGFMLYNADWAYDAATAANADAAKVEIGGWNGIAFNFPDTITDFTGYTITFAIAEDLDAQKANWIDVLGYGEDGIHDMQVAILALNGTAQETIYADGPDATEVDDANGVQDGGAEMTGDKANSDTGVEGIAVVAGLAVVAAGAIVVAKKRK